MTNFYKDIFSFVGCPSTFQSKLVADLVFRILLRPMTNFTENILREALLVKLTFHQQR